MAKCVRLGDKHRWEPRGPGRWKCSVCLSPTYGERVSTVRSTESCRGRPDIVTAGAICRVEMGGNPLNPPSAVQQSQLYVYG